MKKLILIILLLLTTHVYALDINIDTKEYYKYNEEITIKYEIKTDMTTCHLNWTFISTDDLSIKVDNNETNDIKGTIKLKVLNNSNNDETIIIKILYENKYILTKEIIIKSKNETNNIIAEEINNQIDELESIVDKDNYDEIKESVKNIDKILKDKDILNKVDETKLNNYYEIKNNLNKYNFNHKIIIFIIISLIILLLTALFYWFNNKEDI